jgi:hypothetical protein
VGNGAVGVVGRCCSIRRRSVGGTMRPGEGTFDTGATGGGGAAAGISGTTVDAATGAGASTFGALGA